MYMYCHNCGKKIHVDEEEFQAMGIGAGAFGILGLFSSHHPLMFILAIGLIGTGIILALNAKNFAISKWKDKKCIYCKQKLILEKELVHCSEPARSSAQSNKEYPEYIDDSIQTQQRRNEAQQKLRKLEEKYRGSKIIKLDDIIDTDILQNQFDSNDQKTSYSKRTSSDSNVKITEKSTSSERLRSVNTQSLDTWNRLNGCPFYYFYYYVPKRYTNITNETINIRRMIYNFKDGIDYRKVKDLLKDKLRATFGSNLSNIVFVCIPASSKIKSDDRYLEFSEDICNDLGMIDGYPHISFVQEKTPKHLGGTDKAIFEFDKNFFAYHNVVLFDDVVTRGHSMKEFINQLENIHAKVLCQIAIGKTYNNWYITGNPVHPYSGNNALTGDIDDDDCPF